MCPFLHWGVDSLGAKFFEFPVDSGYWSLLYEELAKIFSHAVGCLLSLVTISFLCRSSSLMQSHLFIVDSEPSEFYLGSHSLYLSVPTISWNCLASNS
jgi:hypothetical protein